MNHHFARQRPVRLIEWQARNRCAIQRWWSQTNPMTDGAELTITRPALCTSVFESGRAMIKSVCW